MGKRKGFSAWISGAESSAKSNLSGLTKAGQTFKRNILQHGKGADTAGCSVGVRELGSDGFARYNIDGEAIYITKRSADVFADDEFVDAGSEQFIGRRMVGAQASEPKAAVISQPSTFVPNLGKAAAPKTFKGAGYREDVPAAEAPAKPVKAEQPVAEPTPAPSFLDKVAKRVPRVEAPIEWEDDSGADDDIFIITEDRTEAPVSEAPAEKEAPVETAVITETAVPAVEETVVEAPVEAPVVTEAVVEAPEEAPAEPVVGPVAPVTEAPVSEAPVETPSAESVEAPAVEETVAEPSADVPVEIPAVSVPVAPVVVEAPVETPSAESVEAPVEQPVVAVPRIESVEAPVEEIKGLYTEGDAVSVDSTSSGIAVDRAVAVETSAAVEAPKAVPVAEKPAEPIDLSAYGIKEVSDPVVSRPKPRYRTYKFSGGRLCDSASVEGRKEEPRRPLD